MAIDDTFSFLRLALPFTLASTTILVGYQYAQRSLRRRKVVDKYGCKPVPKYPQKMIFLGLDWLQDMVRAVNAHGFLERGRRLHREIGKTYTTYLLDSSIIHTIEPENLQAVFSTNFKDYGISPQRKTTLGPLLGHSILLLDGTQWERSRAFLRPSFAKVQVSNLVMFEVHVQNLLKAIPSDGSTVDLAALFALLTADVTTDFMFGESINSLTKQSSLKTPFLEDTRIIGTGLEQRFQRGRIANLFPQREFYKRVKEVHAFIDQYVEKVLMYRKSLLAKADLGGEVENGEPERHILLQELGKVTDDRYILRGELLTIFSAGRDTTAVLLSSLFYVLARRSDIWQKLRAEISELQSMKPSFEQLNRMEYLKWSINESLRLNPPLHHTARVALKDTVLPRGGGANGQSPILVPSGTVINLDVSALHRNEDFWGKDAGEFRPERWREDKRPWVRLTFITFSNFTLVHNC